VESAVQLSFHCDDIAVRSVVEQVIGLFPHKKQMAQEVADLLVKNCSAKLKEKHRLQK